jgi:phenylalanyl-tRNA synthetase beta chain
MNFIRSIESLMALQNHFTNRKVSIGVHDMSRIKPPFRYTINTGFQVHTFDFTQPMMMKRDGNLQKASIRVDP